MGIPIIFTCFVAFCLIFAVLRSSIAKKERRISDDFWEREGEANSVRRKSLEGLPYIIIPVSKLPFMDTDDENIKHLQDEIMDLTNRKIVNLSGKSNTDLKLEYGAPNLPELTGYDENFMRLARTLYLWGQALADAHYTSEAISVLEFGVTCKTDILKHYTLLAGLYKFTDDPSKIYSLIMSAEEIESSRKEPIVEALKSILNA